MKKLISIVSVILICAGITAGCRVPLPTLTDLSTVVDKQLLYLGKVGADRVVVDPADGKRYAISASQGALFEPLPPFSEISLSRDDSGAPQLASGTQLAVRAPVVAARSAKQAATAYPAALLDSLMFRSGSEYALQEYAVKSSKVLSDKDGKVVVEFVADVKPVADPFQPFAGSAWGKPGPDGFVRDCRLTIDLYTNGNEYCLYAPEGGLFAGGALDATYSPAGTLYRPAQPGDVWQALDNGQEVEYVVYEDPTYSFVFGVRLRKDPTAFFAGTVYRINRATGERVAALDLPRNTLAVSPLALNGRTLYLNTTSGEPYSEGLPGDVAAFDLDTFQYTVLLTGEATTIGAVRDVVYIIGFATRQRLGAIYALDTAGGAIRKISNLPGHDYNPAYDTSGIQHFTGGRLYVFWPEPMAGVPGPTYGIYAIDPATSAIERQP